MRAKGLKIGLLGICALTLWANSACVSKRHGTAAEAELFAKNVPIHDKGWWKAAFFMAWPEGEEPSWHVDLAIAHRIIWPVLRRFDPHIVTWRFHRRAERDKTGHRFSFIFYASAPTAQKVFDAIRADQDFRAMKTAGTILKNAFDDTSKVRNPHLEDTCPADWPKAIKKTWPYFIKGASESWLHLVVHLAKDKPDMRSTLPVEQVVALYKGIDRVVGALWQEEGSRAFLHHLNAIFGYKELIVYEKRRTAF